MATQNMQSDEQNRFPAGRTLKELTTPRPFGMPSPDIFDGALLKIERRLQSSVPEAIRTRITLARNLAVYGGFCYEFITVSAFSCMTCVEMALWAKFAELNPGPFVLEKKKYQPVSVTLSQLPGNLRLGWRIAGRPNFNGSFRSLTAWAIDEKLIPDDGSLDATIRLRNSFAHPFETNYVWSPPMTVQVFEGLIETVNHLWPLDMPPDDDKLVLKLR